MPDMVVVAAVLYLISVGLVCMIVGIFKIYDCLDLINEHGLSEGVAIFNKNEPPTHLLIFHLMLWPVVLVDENWL